MDVRGRQWKDDTRAHPVFLSIILATALHLIIYALLFATPTREIFPVIEDTISVQIINQRPSNPTTAPPKTEPTPDRDIDQPALPPPLPRQKPAPVKPPLAPNPEVTPQTETPLLETPEETPVEAPVTPTIIAGPQHDGDEKDDDVPSTYVPSQWALEPALSDERLHGIFGEGFDNDIKCLRSLSEDCDDLRRSVFSDYQLTEQDLIWTESFAHNGLTNPELHGLSEREIRQKLAIPIAGDNGFVILPGIAIDGNLWDSLHGVNKKCPVLRGVRRCPDLAPKADDKRFHIPKKE